MKVEIWSDVMCPFCYIGKRKFEKALAQFTAAETVEVVWKSFQLDPNLKTDPTKNTRTHLAESKGWTLEYTKGMTDHVSQMAEKQGLTFDFDRAVVANSFDAHRFSAFAKTKGLQDAAEERLFAAYFTEGRNTADMATLVELGSEIGLNPQELQAVLQSDAFTDDVRTDIYQARQLGINGVPFFVFNEKYAVSGAQETHVFLDVLNKTYSETANASVSMTAGESCELGENC
jgi:predicted DsbA family dithiol-disulfide isomerase